MSEMPPGTPPAPIQHPKPVIPVRAQVVLVLGATLAMIVAVIAGAWVNTNLSSVNSSQQAQIDQLSANNDALRDQIIAQGETPVAPPAEAVTGEQGPVGATGANGLNGKDGRGVVGYSCQSDGRWLVNYDDGSRQYIDGPCFATDGTDGTNGTNGVNGAPGQPPSSWSWSWHNTNYVCSRDAPFDPASPTYSCTQN